MNRYKVFVEFTFTESYIVEAEEPEEAADLAYDIAYEESDGADVIISDVVDADEDS